MTHVNFSDFRAHMARHLDKVEADRTELVVTRQGHEPVVLMTLADLEGLRETLRERDPRKLIPPLHGALLKNEQDVHLFERLAFLNRRERG